MKFFKKKKSVTAIGQLVDLSMSDFKKYLKENNVNIVFEQNDPKLETDAEYIASYRLM